MSEPLPAVPQPWGDLSVRLRFFDLLPSPLNVLIACDLASLPPQDELGYWGINIVRRWLIGRASRSDLRTAWRQLRQALEARQERPWNSPHYAVLYAIGAALWESSSDYAATTSLAAALGADPDNDPEPYARQWERIDAVIRCTRNSAVERLAEVARQDPGVRPLLWDALHESGYTPLAPRLT